MRLFVVENAQLIEYRRRGECAGCGDCCRRLIRFQRYFPNGGVPGGDLTEWEGWSVLPLFGSWVYMKLSHIGEAGTGDCDFFDEDTGECAMFKKDLEKFGLLCWLFPVHPDNLACFPRCGFSFERVQSVEG